MLRRAYKHLFAVHIASAWPSSVVVATAGADIPKGVLMQNVPEREVVDYYSKKLSRCSLLAYFRTSTYNERTRNEEC